jgi:GT2 family glycosyltransferase
MSPRGSIGVVVPVRDGGRYLDAALDSLERCADVGQVVVVDDASRDDSATIAERRAGVELIRRTEQVGPAAARNLGVAALDREIVGFLDADDRWTVAGSDPRLDPLHRDPELDIVFARLCMLRRRADGGEERSAPRRHMQLGAALVRRRLFDRIGGFDPAAIPAEDLDWFARARQAGARMSFVPAVTLDYRRHAGQLTSSSEILVSSTLLAARRALGRRRR